MKKYLFFLAISAILGGSSTPKEKTLSLMTYNVGVFSKYSDSSMPEVAGLIMRENVSLVSLNELDSCNRRHGTFQLKELAEALDGWDFHFARAFAFAGGAYGNGVVSREPILWSGRIALPQGNGAEERSVAIVETASCVFASAHLDHVGKEARLEQARIINEWFNDRYSGYRKPVLLCGDMNDVPESATLAQLGKAWKILSGTGYTSSTEDPHACIDYIFALKSAVSVKVRDCHVLTEGTASLSDHFPIRLDISFIPGKN